MVQTVQFLFILIAFFPWFFFPLKLAINIKYNRFIQSKYLLGERFINKLCFQISLEQKCQYENE